MKIEAVLWDYDGTLVNSVPKNIDITKQILKKVAPRLTEQNLPKYLKSEAEYHIANHQSKNWQDLYINYYGMTEDEMRSAGALWTEYQLKNTTPVELFDKVLETVKSVNIPQGICSQNSSTNIERLLIRNNIAHKFNAIIGYDDIPHNRQKPHPFGGIKCLESIFGDINHKTIIYIGDHEGDVEFARNINKTLGDKSKVVAVTANYSGAKTADWRSKPDYEIQSPLELIALIDSYN